MAEPGSVAFNFARKGQIRLKGSGDEVQLQAIEAGADDVEDDADNNETVVYTAPSELAKVRDTLKEAGLEVVEAELTYVAGNTLEISDKETARKAMNLMNALDELDDVTNTHTNFDLADGIEV